MGQRSGIINVCPGRDGLILILDMVSSTGVFSRSIQKLYDLEIMHNPNDVTVNSYDAIDEKLDSNDVEPIDNNTDNITVTKFGRHVRIPKRYGL